jgi:hypothetical protein
VRVRRIERNQRGKGWSEVLRRVDQAGVRSGRSQGAGPLARSPVMAVAVMARCATDLRLFRYRMVAVSSGCMVLAVAGLRPFGGLAERRTYGSAQR